MSIVAELSAALDRRLDGVHGPTNRGSQYDWSVPRPTVIVLHGDQTGEELLREALRLLELDVLGFEVKRKDFDLSLDRRRETRNQVVHDAAEALQETGFGLKAATITPEG